jgi:hypothetical protein
MPPRLQVRTAFLARHEPEAHHMPDGRSTTIKQNEGRSRRTGPLAWQMSTLAMRVQDGAADDCDCQGADHNQNCDDHRHLLRLNSTALRATAELAVAASVLGGREQVRGGRVGRSRESDGPGEQRQHGESGQYLLHGIPPVVSACGGVDCIRQPDRVSWSGPADRGKVAFHQRGRAEVLHTPT